MDFLDNVSNWPSIIKIGFDISLKYTIVWLVKDKEPRKHYHKKAGSNCRETELAFLTSTQTLRYISFIFALTHLVSEPKQSLSCIRLPSDHLKTFLFFRRLSITIKLISTKLCTKHPWLGFLKLIQTLDRSLLKGR